MNEISRVLSRIERGDPHAAELLLPLVYPELRKLAAQKMAQEPPGQTLQATELVHEAYLRLVPGAASSSQAGDDEGLKWNTRGHFFAAAAEAMRRILLERARRKGRTKHGGGRSRIALDAVDVAAPETPDDLLMLDEALTQLAAADAQAGELVKLRYFAGLTIKQAAQVLGISPRATDMLWAYARAWLLRKMEDAESPKGT